MSKYRKDRECTMAGIASVIVALVIGILTVCSVSNYFEYLDKIRHQEYRTKYITNCHKLGGKVYEDLHGRLICTGYTLPEVTK